MRELKKVFRQDFLLAAVLMLACSQFFHAQFHLYKASPPALCFQQDRQERQIASQGNSAAAAVHTCCPICSGVLTSSAPEYFMEAFIPVSHADYFPDNSGSVTTGTVLRHFSRGPPQRLLF